VNRTGGYGGVHGTATVDTSHLESVRAQEIEQLAEQALASAGRSAEPIGADLMRYEITIEQENQRRSFTFVDDGTAGQSPIRRLIEAVQRGASA
jgi:emfourin